MSLSDSLSLHHLLHDDSPAPLQFTSKQLESLPAIANGYQQTIEFDTHSLTGKWVSLEEAWLSLPLVLTGTGANFSKTDPDAAFKGSALSLINGISVRTSAGQSLVEERNSTVYASHLRLMLEKPSNWYVSNSDDLMYAKDQCEPDVVSGLSTAAALANPSLRRYTGAPAAADNADSTIYNKGFAIRKAKLIGSATTRAVGGITTYLNIKLSAIHSFFEALNFPFVNCRLFFTFYCNFTGAGNAYLPFCNGRAMAGGTAIAADVPQVAINVAAGVPRLWYHALTFSEEQNALVAAQLEKGFVKKLRYTITDMYAQQRAHTVASLSVPIATNIINPKRIYALVQPAGVVNGSTWPSPLATGAENYLTQVNVMINNANYLSQTLDTPESQYEALRSAMPMHGYGGVDADLSYADWLKTYRIVCLDISRAGSQTVDRNQPVSLMFTGTIVNALGGAINVDLTYLVEREQQTVFSFGAGEFKIITGSQLFR